MRYFTLHPNYFRKEGFGTLMTHYALMYCIHRDTNVTPCILNINFKARNMISAMEFFNNFDNEPILYHKDVFPNLRQIFPILDEHDAGTGDWFTANMVYLSYDEIVAIIKNTPANIMCTWMLQNSFIESRLEEICNILFAFDSDLINKCQQILPKTTKTLTGICVRTEYKKLHTPHIKLSLNFYKTAMEQFDDKTTKYLIFSDNIDEAKQMLEPLSNQFDIEYTQKNMPSAVGMCTMSLCNNIICANSGFSYWASLLNKHHDKKIVCPCQFVIDDKEDATANALNYKWYPKTWTALDII